MHFNVTASPGELVARLNLEDSLLMPPALTVGELEAWATDLVDRIAEAIACCKQSVSYTHLTLPTSDLV